jgi:hypothetical protein
MVQVAPINTGILLLLLLYFNGRQASFLSSHCLFNFCPVLSVHLEVFQGITKPFVRGRLTVLFPFDFCSNSPETKH